MDKKTALEEALEASKASQKAAEAAQQQVGQYKVVRLHSFCKTRSCQPDTGRQCIDTALHGTSAA